MKISLSFLALFCVLLTASTCQETKSVVIPEVKESVTNELVFPNGSSVLVYYRTDGFKHASISEGRSAIKSLADSYGFAYSETYDPRLFSQEELSKHDAVIFLNTTLDVLAEEQQDHFERYIQAGGGYVGVHGAADTEYGWPWYGNLVGGYFDGHPSSPNVREGVLTVVDGSHVSTNGLPETWTRTDEYYSYKTFNDNVNVLITVDEKSYMDEVQSDYHPIAWYHEFDGGRSFYTGLGHTKESYSEQHFLNHLIGGIHYAVGGASPLTYTSSNVKPEQNRFVKETYLENLTEPMELELLPSGKIVVIERAGAIYTYDPATGQRAEVTTLPVHKEHEDGLIGIAIDPNYATNNWIYLHYSPLPDEIPRQRISRFVFDGQSLDMDSEKILLEYKNQRDECCHAGGSLEFDRHGNLFASSGDNTNPFASDGYSPIDGQDGRLPWDGRRGPGNTNDLRGKIMRITPQDDGSYSIPDGNLFPKDGSVGRPEIYIMGNRNPFRISIDQKNDYLYWGEVGPDARDDEENRGPKGHDEINQARKAGNFGWPLFVGNNKAYKSYNFAAKKSGSGFDPSAPLNDSPNNTGARILPPAQPAFIWYPYGPSEEFPLMGEGGRNAMAGPVFYHDTFEKTEDSFPAYYDGKLIIYEWIRSFVAAVTLDENGDYQRMEHMMTDVELQNPMDMMFGPDGTLYVLEYGKKWFSQNIDARLSRIRYQAGNRRPIARAKAANTIGAVPLTVTFSSEGSVDPDGDGLRYKWAFEGVDGPSSNEKNPSHSFAQAGVYTSRLVVTDPNGNSSESSVTIYAGNTAPEVDVEFTKGGAFAIPGEEIDYAVKVTDAEDGGIGSGIDPSSVKVTIDYLPQGRDKTKIAQGHQVLSDASDAFAGKGLMANSDCSSCHVEQEESIGPAYVDIAKKYSGQEGSTNYLSSKIVKGGTGVWGDRVMAAHPSVSIDDARQMVQYIKSFADDKEEVAGLATTGSFVPENKDKEDGSYVMMITYTDKGAEGAGPLTARKTIVFKSPRIQAENYDAAEIASAMELPKEAGPMAGLNVLMASGKGHAIYKGLDLSRISEVVLNALVPPGFTAGGTIELRSSSVDGKLLGSVDLTPEGMALKERVISINASGLTDVVLVFNTPTKGDGMVALIDWIEFR